MSIKENKKQRMFKTVALDSAGIIYPYTSKKDWTNAFRVEALMKSPVNVEALQKAVCEMQELYPYFFSHMVKEKRAFCLKESEEFLKVEKDSGEVCRAFDMENKSHLMRVLYTENKISLEFFHSITDGHGSMNFFTELLLHYKKYNDNSEANLEIVQKQKNDSLCNLNDIFKDICTEKTKSANRLVLPAFSLRKIKREKDLKVTHVCLNSEKLRALAKSHRVTVTVFMCAVVMTAIHKNSEKSNKPIRLSVPVDIRRFFDRTTSRNGSLYFFVEAKPKDFESFPKLLACIKEQFEKEINRDNFHKMAYANVSQADLPIFKILPIFMKKLVLNIGYNFLGENQYTSTLTNVGVIDIPTSLNSVVSDMYYVLSEQRINPINFTLSSFGSTVRLVSSSSIDDSDFIKSITDMFDSDILLDA